jgi:hypothetical protein
MPTPRVVGGSGGSRSSASCTTCRAGGGEGGCRVGRMGCGGGRAEGGRLHQARAPAAPAGTPGCRPAPGASGGREAPRGLAPAPEARAAASAPPPPPPGRTAGWPARGPARS